MIGLMKRILTVSGIYQKRILLAFVFSFLKSLLSKAPIMLAFLVLTGFYEGSISARSCLLCGLAMVLCVAFQAVFQNIADRLQSAAGFMVFSDMRMELGAHLRRMPMGYFTEGNIGKISSVLSSDMVFIEENCMTVLADMMSYIFAEIIMVVFLFLLNPWIGLMALAVIGVILFVAEGMKKEAMEDSVLRQEQNEHLTEAVLDFVEGIGIIKTYNLLGEKSKALSENFRRSCETNLKFEEDHSPWQLRLNIVYGLGSAAIAGLSFLLWRQGMLTIPDLIGILLFVFDLFGPIKALYTQATRLTVMNSCMDRIEEVFSQPELPDDGLEKIPSAGHGPEVEFRNVRFGYEEKEVLHDLSFLLPKNQMLALVGPSGGGKSTIANLLTRFWDPFTVKELGVAGAITVLLKDAINPNLVQTTEGSAAFVHGGPFANIAHGCNSILATKMAMTFGDYVVTEAGFGADLGAEKFYNIKCRKSGLQPKLTIIVATAQGLKMHGGVSLDRIKEPNMEGLKEGFGNLDKHVRNLRSFGQQVIVAFNRFASDTDEEVEAIRRHCEEKLEVGFAVNNAFAKGGEGAVDLANLVVDTIENKPSEPLTFTYTAIGLWGFDFGLYVAACSPGKHGY